ncbi:MAG TPA: tRNA lysidine(34) synthetase TilS [Sediminispirochaeta sp.]|nr:tRNA lysidine(34) synthetase TilS [Sediminispirochaeta sp.]
MSSIEKTLLQEIDKNLSLAKLAPGQRLLLAFSGGPDSRSLLHMLSLLSKTYRFDIQLGYVEHGLRSSPERKEELRMVTATAARYQVPLYVLNLPPGCITGQHDGIEAGARRYRHVFLHKLLRVSGARYLVFGHTWDDQVETLIMRFFQGSGLEGLTGMSGLEGPIMRPLLKVKKRTLLEYSRVHGLGYSQDSSNTEKKYLRNRLRLELIPRIRDIFPGLDLSLENFIHKMRSLEELIPPPKSSELISDDGGRTFYMDHDLFFSWSLYQRTEVVYEVFDRWNESENRRLPYRFVLDLCRRRSEDTRHSYGCGHGIAMEKEGSLLFWRPCIVPKLKKRYLKVIKADTQVKYSGLSFKATRRRGGACLLRLETAVKYAPWILRSPGEGERITLPEGSKRIGELLREREVSPSRENSCVVVEDRRGILALLFLGRNFWYRKSLLADTNVESDIYYIELAMTDLEMSFE